MSFHSLFVSNVRGQARTNALLSRVMPLLILTLCLASRVTFAHTPAMRVISLAPHTTELAYTAGLGKHLIAVSEHSDYPKEARSLEKVANYQGINIERILALKPDLVIAWPEGNPAKSLAILRQFHIPIYYAKSKTLNDIAINIEQLSQYSDTPEIGLAAAQSFRHQLQSLKAKYHTNDKVRYFYQLGQHPLMTAGGNHWPNEVFQFCGGLNAFANTQVPYPQVSVEQVLLAQPNAIFTTTPALISSPPWQHWQHEIPALQHRHIWSLKADWINRPTFRTLHALNAICEHFKTIREKR